MEDQEEKVSIQSDFSFVETMYVLSQLFVQMKEGVQTTKVLQYVPYENNEKIAIISRGRVSKYFVMTNLTADDLKALFSDVWNTTTQDNKLGGGSR